MLNLPQLMKFSFPPFFIIFEKKWNKFSQIMAWKGRKVLYKKNLLTMILLLLWYENSLETFQNWISILCICACHKIKIEKCLFGTWHFTHELLIIGTWKTLVYNSGNNQNGLKGEKIEWKQKIQTEREQISAIMR